MKMILLLVGFFSASMVYAQKQAPVTNRAVAVTVYGGFTGFDPDGYKVIRAAMAALIMDGTVAHFVTKAYGQEGGHEFCVELANDPDLSIERITKMLDVIKPGNNTAYSYSEVINCQE